LEQRTKFRVTIINQETEEKQARIGILQQRIQAPEVPKTGERALTVMDASCLGNGQKAGDIERVM